MQLRCVDCGHAMPADVRYACEKCGGILEVEEPIGTSIGDHAYLRRTMWRYADRLSVADAGAIVSLGEGCTPLHRAKRLEASIPGFKGEIWIKDETINPTGSFKDRLISAAVSRARELECRGIICASSGNAGASTAAYAARAGMDAIIVVPTRTPEEKLTQIASYGALLVKVDGHYSHSYDVAIRLAEEQGLFNVTTTFLNPYGVDALKVVGEELAEQLGGRVPDYVLVPTGAGPLVKGVVQGFAERPGGRLPKTVAVQAAGCAPIVRAFERGEETVTAWGEPQTIASGISDPLIGYERDGSYTLRLVRQSGGLAAAVSDDEIRAAMSDLARMEGLLAEPTGASSFAAARKLIETDRISRDAIVVCMVTGHGYKDMKVFRSLPIRVSHLPAEPVAAQLASVLEAQAARRIKLMIVS